LNEKQYSSWQHVESYAKLAEVYEDIEEYISEIESLMRDEDFEGMYQVSDKFEKDHNLATYANTNVITASYQRSGVSDDKYAFWQTPLAYIPEWTLHFKRIFEELLWSHEDEKEPEIDLVVENLSKLKNDVKELKKVPKFMEDMNKQITVSKSVRSLRKLPKNRSFSKNITLRNNIKALARTLVMYSVKYNENEITPAMPASEWKTWLKREWEKYKNDKELKQAYEDEREIDILYSILNVDQSIDSTITLGIDPFNDYIGLIWEERVNGKIHSAKEQGNERKIDDIAEILSFVGSEPPLDDPQVDID
jgi:hypothetical protein